MVADEADISNTPNQPPVVSVGTGVVASAVSGVRVTLGAKLTDPPVVPDENVLEIFMGTTNAPACPGVIVKLVALDKFRDGLAVVEFTYILPPLYTRALVFAVAETKVFVFKAWPFISSVPLVNVVMPVVPPVAATVTSVDKATVPVMANVNTPIVPDVDILSLQFK
jgi:hypothetical protein